MKNLPISACKPLDPSILFSFGKYDSICFHRSYLVDRAKVKITEMFYIQHFFVYSAQWIHCERGMIIKNMDSFLSASEFERVVKASSYSK